MPTGSVPGYAGGGRRDASRRGQSPVVYLVDGVGLIVGIDRFMSEARALTNFSGNAVATVIIGKMVGEFDRDKAKGVLAGDDPFDEAIMLDEDDIEPPPLAEHPVHPTDGRGPKAEATEGAAV